MLMRAAAEDDRAFIVEMARLACGLEGRHPVPAADDPAVLAMLPGDGDVAVVAVDDAAKPVGAAWCHTQNPPLLLDEGERRCRRWRWACCQRRAGVAWEPPCSMLW